MTYNIYLLPKIAGNTGQKPRTKALIDYFNESPYDVLLLQEVFINKLREELTEGLKAKYPYVAGPPGTDKFITQDGGAMVYSKFPILRHKSIVYDECKGIDCKSMKGAVWAELDLGDGKRIQVISTHAQSEDGEEKQNIRFAQYKQVVDSLLKPNRVAGVPQFFGGDFNTNRYDTAYYQTMMEVLGLVDTYLPLEQPTYTYNGEQCDLVKAKSKTDKVFLDYVLFQPNGVTTNVQHAAMVRPQSQWSKKNKDLSDHFAFDAHLSLTWSK